MLTVTRSTRQAPSTHDLLDTSAAEKADWSVGDTWADTTTALSRLMLTVLGGLAEFERGRICARTVKSRKRAKARGETMGRKPNSLCSRS